MSADRIAPLIDDDAPRVREQAVAALGKIGGPKAERALVEALDDADGLVQERAAETLVSIGGSSAIVPLLELISRSSDAAMAARLAARLDKLSSDAERSALASAIRRVGHDHPAYEPLLELQLASMSAAQPEVATASNIDETIVEAFPTWARLSQVRGFVPLARSVRTAEMIHRASGGADADQSAAIVLWTKALEGYLHAWLSPKLSALDQRGALFELVDRIQSSTWPTYQRWLAARWSDPVMVGELEVELPLRAIINTLRDLGAPTGGRRDGPRSVTEWGRLMIFLAIDHPSGARNVLAVSSKDPERILRLAHRLQILAQARNAVTHRTVAARATVEAFRGLYYPTFEELTAVT